MSEGETMEVKLADVESATSSNMVSGNVYNTLETVFEHITTVVHTLTVGFVIILIYLIFSHDFYFFQWHPLLLTLGWVLLMTEAILMFSKENIFSKRLTHAAKVKFHWYLQILAVSLTVAGFVVVEIAKVQNNREHFTSWHGKFGLAGVVFSVVATLNGFLALYNVDLRKYIKPNLNKLFHVVSGTLAFLFGGISILVVIFTSGWFTSRTNEAVKITCFVILLVSIVWTLIRPVLTTFTRVKALR